ncbi:hypothetical protein J3458_013134 [Metarhizium acridum]|nr:hypothetical protein J3458_013134 [Metarhizium acridum]
MTCVGSKARIWAYKWNDDYVTPILPLGDELSEIGQYAEYSTHSKELVEALKHVKKNPIPDKATFENPQSPRPLSATLPDGWHDREVAFMSSATSYQAEADPGTALLQLPRSGCVRQAQAADTYQGMLDPNQSYEITVERFENRVYQCLRVVDGARVNVPEGGWGQCTILSSETLYPCYSWVGESGTQYFAWSLGSEEARGQ